MNFVGIETTTKRTFGIMNFISKEKHFQAEKIVKHVSNKSIPSIEHENRTGTKIHPVPAPVPEVPTLKHLSRIPLRYHHPRAKRTL
jgi:hypothetical protein